MKFALGVFCLALVWGSGASLSCMPCVMPGRTRAPCPPVYPTSCERAYRMCGCCPVCALGPGQPCSSMAQRCASGLVCRTSEGDYVGRPPWYKMIGPGICVLPGSNITPPPTGRPRPPPGRPGSPGRPGRPGDTGPSGPS